VPDDRFIHRKAGHSEKVNLLTDLEHRVWVQMILSADDFGVLRASAVTLQADNDHLANRPATKVQRCIDAVIKRGLFNDFTHQGRRYAFQKDWQFWQKVSYPRATNNPKPPADGLAICDEPTQKLFGMHPGGGGKKRKEDSEKVPGKFPEDSPPMRAGAPAKRLTANGDRLTASSEEEKETSPFDVWFQWAWEHYPEARRSRGLIVQQAFVEQLMRYKGGVGAGWLLFQTNLMLNVTSHEWLVKGMAPSMTKYLTEGRWMNALPAEAPASERLSKSSAVTFGGAAEFLAEDKRGA
jgi:hypothetical protein